MTWIIRRIWDNIYCMYENVLRYILLRMLVGKGNKSVEEMIAECVENSIIKNYEFYITHFPKIKKLLQKKGLLEKAIKLSKASRLLSRNNGHHYL